MLIPWGFYGRARQRVKTVEQNRGVHKLEVTDCIVRIGTVDVTGAKDSHPIPRPPLPRLGKTDIGRIIQMPSINHTPPGLQCIASHVELTFATDIAC